MGNIKSKKLRIFNNKIRCTNFDYINKYEYYFLQYLEIGIASKIKITFFNENEEKIRIKEK